MKLLTLILLALCSCSAGVTGAQSLAGPYHLYAEAEAGLALDVNSEGGALCTAGAVKVVIYRAKDGERQDLGDFTHDGALVPAAAYVFGRGDSGWYLTRLSTAEGRERYPAPFEACAQLAPERPAGLRAAPSAPAAIVWRELVQ